MHTGFTGYQLTVSKYEYPIIGIFNNNTQMIFVNTYFHKDEGLDTFISL